MDTLGGEIERPKRIPRGVLVVIIAGIIVFWCLNAYLLYDVDDKGLYGDMFGAVNALFSGLAFFGVIWAIILQREELGHQREELALTRQEIRGQKDQMITQNKTLLLQQFENTFFQMVNLFRNTAESVTIPFLEDRVGADAFYLVYSRMENNHKKIGGPSTLAKIVEVYSYEDVAYGQYFATYYRTFYQILSLIDSTDLGNKQRYADLLKAQIRDLELVVLFYYSLSIAPPRELTSLLHDYAMFEHLQRHLLFDPEDYVLFPPEE